MNQYKMNLKQTSPSSLSMDTLFVDFDAWRVKILIVKGQIHVLMLKGLFSEIIE